MRESVQAQVDPFSYIALHWVKLTEKSTLFMVFWGQFVVLYGLKCMLFLWHQHQLNLYSFEQIWQYWSIKLCVLYAPIALYFDIYDWILTKLLPQNCMRWVLLWGEMPIFIDFYSFHPFLKSVFYFRVRVPKLTFDALFWHKAYWTMAFSFVSRLSSYKQTT